MLKGLLVSVLRNAEFGQSTNGGISSNHTSFILVGKGIPEIFTADERHPALKLVRRKLGGRYGEYLHVEPIDQPQGVCGPMFGGNFIHSSDSRFPSVYPIPIHDRFESVESYNLNSM